MAISATLSKSVTAGQKTISRNVTINSDRLTIFDENLIIGQVSEVEYVVDLPLTELNFFAFVSTQDGILFVNDTNTPADTITFKANRPVIWEEGDPTLITNDITSLYFSNSSSSEEAQVIFLAGRN